MRVRVRCSTGSGNQRSCDGWVSNDAIIEPWLTLRVSNRQRRDRGFIVEVRRPLQISSPSDRLIRRWRKRSTQRRAARTARRDDGEFRWREALDFIPNPNGGFAAALAAAILLVVLLVVPTPFVWILVLFPVELLVWLLVRRSARTHAATVQKRLAGRASPTAAVTLP